MQPLPTREAALAAVQSVDPAAYARTRNHLNGAVTGWSPYLTHGLLQVRECVEALGLSPHDKLTYELGWREFFQHVWAHRGDGILNSLHEGPLPEAAYATELPQDIRTAATGVPVVDEAVRTLYRTGLLHNHARMWLASYVVHGRKVHWRAGADWLYGHLLDGDLASNHLSWQWVAATGSHKPYVFDAANVARFAPRAWHSPGSAVDMSYAEWDDWARSPQALPAGSPAAARAALEEPACSAAPALGGAVQQGLPSMAVLGSTVSTVWLVHPWALGEPPDGASVVAVVVRDAHAAFPWSAARWQWVTTRQQALGGTVWLCSAAELAAWAAACRGRPETEGGPVRVMTVGNPHIDRWWPAAVQVQAAPRHFPAVDRVCASFSSWWRRASGLDLPRRPHAGD